LHLPHLIQDLAVILGVASVVTLIFKRIQQPLVLGYIVAGIIVGPFTPPIFSVTDTNGVKIWAELGVIFLMFALGLEFSFDKLIKMGMRLGLFASMEVCFATSIGFAVLKITGLETVAAFFIAAALAISSTTVILKSFEEDYRGSAPYRTTVKGLLIWEDLIAIGLMVILNQWGNAGTLDWVEFYLTMFRLIGILAGWFVVARLVVPRFYTATRAIGTQEHLMITAVALCLVAAVIAAHFGLSSALGAFLIGSILASSDKSGATPAIFSPIKHIFGAIFFVSIGMLLDPTAITEHPVAIATLISIVWLAKSLAIVLSGRMLKYDVETSVRTGMAMAQVGEFSFILIALGSQHGLIPDYYYPVIVVVSCATTFTTPILIGWSKNIVKWLNP
jgi:monovalent cation:H+ antiporter-2, CPA2 family